jgi:RNA polymerase sigma-70 factor (ECF subfamily)
MKAEVSVTAQPRALEDLVEDEATFRAWYDRTLPRVYRYLLARCDDEGLAEELTQQTFIEAIRHRHQFAGRSDVVTWLIAISRRKLLDHYRRAGSERRRSLRIADHASPSVISGPDETRLSVLDALDQLAPDHRLALTYRYLDQLPVREIAEALGRTESATESLLSRARDAFRLAYGAETDG